MENMNPPVILEHNSKGSMIATSVGLLVVGLVAGYFVGTSVSSSEVVNQTATPITPVDTSSRIMPSSNADLVLESHGINDLVMLPVTVRGYVNGMGWAGNEGELGTLQVFDGNMLEVSEVGILRATSDWLILPTYFSVTVGDRQMMSELQTSNGFFKFTSKAEKDGEESIGVLIPIRFR